MDFITNDMSDQEIMFPLRKRRERAPKWKIRSLKYEKSDMEKICQLLEKYPEFRQCINYKNLFKHVSERITDIDSKLSYTYSKIKKYPTKIHKIPSDELEQNDPEKTNL